MQIFKVRYSIKISILVQFEFIDVIISFSHSYRLLFSHFNDAFGYKNHRNVEFIKKLLSLQNYILYFLNI